MPTTFLHLPSEIRNIIYEDVLVLKDGQAVRCTSKSSKKGFALGLLIVSRKIHREATSMLYSRNRFHFWAEYPLDKYWFFVGIGSINASYIRHIICPFPMLEFQTRFWHLSGDIGTARPVRKWYTDLETIGKCCGRLDTFTMVLSPQQTDRIRTELAGSGLMERMDGSFKDLPSQPDVIVEVSGKESEAAGSALVRHMKQIGWTIRITQ